MPGKLNLTSGYTTRRLRQPGIFFPSQVQLATQKLPCNLILSLYCGSYPNCLNKISDVSGALTSKFLHGAGSSAPSFAPRPMAPLKAATQARFEHLTLEQGLPDNHVWAVTQDDRASSGLELMMACHCDGYQFKVYRHDRDNPRNLSRVMRALLRTPARCGWRWNGGLNKRSGNRIICSLFA
jgi:hypothetical protein